jgi:hypothetical protein
MMRRPIRLLLPVLLLAAAGLACNRGVRQDNQQEPAPRSDDPSSELDEAADQVEALLDELETENAQADSLDDVVEEPARETESLDTVSTETPPPTLTPEPPSTESTDSLSPEAGEMLSTLEALVGELDDLNAEGDPLDNLP